MRMNESTNRILRSRSRSIVRQRKTSYDNVSNKKITEKELIQKSSVIDDFPASEETIYNDAAVFEDRLHGNGDVEIRDNLANESFNRIMDDDSPWQNGRYKSASEIVNYYRSLGDWWNYLPKTDNTYNPMSKWYRKEIAPGIPMIPNMARPPLHPFTPKSSHFSWFTREHSNVSSSKELSGENCTNSSSCVQTSWFRRIVTTIVTVVTTVWTTVTFSEISRRAQQVNGVQTPVPNQRLKGRLLFQEANAWWRLPFVWLYKLMVNLFAVDIGILALVRQTSSRVQSRTGIKVLTLILLLLPLLLFFGLYRDQLSNHSGLLTEVVESTKASFAYVYSSFYNWSYRCYSGIIAYWNESSKYSGFHDFLDTVSDAFKSAGHSVWNFLLYLYSLLVLLPSLFPRYSTSSGGSHRQMTAPLSMSRDQLVVIVQEAVRETLKQDSAVLIEDTINNPRLKVLLDQVLSDKMKDLDPTVLLSSDQWRSAIKEAISIYNVENPNKEGEIMQQKLDDIRNEINDRISRLEEKVDLMLDKFVTRKNVEDAIKNLTGHFNYQLKIEGEHVMERVLAEITEKVKDEVTTLFYSLKRNHHQVELTTPGEMNLTQIHDYVSVMIERALCLYDADKTGMVDYALESSGGHVLNTRCTESYNAGHQTYVLFGFALWRSSNSPRTLIQPGVHPGECWAFSGQQGYIVLQLSSTIIVTGFTVEHIPRSLAPHGRIDSAPKDFSVWGLRDEDDKDETFLGRYRFQENGTSLQMFKAVPVDDPFRLVELKIESNHGNLEYTCLYRFRVHGVPVS